MSTNEPAGLLTELAAALGCREHWHPASSLSVFEHGLSPGSSVSNLPQQHLIVCREQALLVFYTFHVLECCFKWYLEECFVSQGVLLVCRSAVGLALTSCPETRPSSCSSPRRLFVGSGGFSVNIRLSSPVKTFLFFLPRMYSSCFSFLPRDTDQTLHTGLASIFLYL